MAGTLGIYEEDQAYQSGQGASFLSLRLRPSFQSFSPVYYDRLYVSSYLLLRVASF